MRDYKLEVENRISFIRDIVASAKAKGVIFANSGGKDAVLTGILCKKACDDTVGLILPCCSKQNYESDKTDAEIVADKYNIATRYIDLAGTQNQMIEAIYKTKYYNYGNSSDKDIGNDNDNSNGNVNGNSNDKDIGSDNINDNDNSNGNDKDNDNGIRLSETAIGNIASRLRMIALYTIGSSENRLVAGTGNRSERFMGYFTKWGDGAYDFNPIADLTVTEIYEFLRYFDVLDHIISKAPSAGLFDGQTDEDDMGVTYKSIDNYLLNGATNERDTIIIKRYHNISEHKRKPPLIYSS